LKSYDEWKADGAKITRCNRYNRVPDHLKDTGVCFIKCDTSFLPGSVGVGVGKEDRDRAMKVIQEKRKDALLRSGEEAVDGADAAEAGKTREHLQPNSKRMKVEDDGENRKALTNAVTQLIAIKADKAAEQKASSKLESLNQQLSLYIGHLANPGLSESLKKNFERMIESIQLQLQECLNPVVPPLAPRKLASSFHTPPSRSALPGRAVSSSPSDGSSAGGSDCQSASQSPAAAAGPSP
jgi:hypothetical protein